MIRILHVIGSLDNGGSQAMVMNLYRNIDRTKIQFDFVIHRKDELFFADEIESLGGKIYTLPPFNIRNIYRYIKSWNDFFKYHNYYRIIHGHVRSTASIYLSIAKRYGLKTISHSHSTSSGDGIQAIIKDVLQYPIRYIADYFMACSEDAGKWLFGKKICESEKFTILNNSIDCKKFIYNERIRQIKRKELNIDKSFVIGHIGRFHKAKNHEFLLDILYELSIKHEDTVLLLIGDGELRFSIENKAKEKGLFDKVIFAETRSDIPDLLQSMDVFVFPSLYEGLGIVAIEAQASGLQTFISDAVPKEVMITDCAHQISLSESESVWASRIIEYNNGYERRNMYDDIFNQKYDIKETVKWIERFYLEWRL